MNKDKKIEAILESLNDIEKGVPRPFFFNRLEAKMQNAKKEAGAVVRFITMPVVAIAAAMAIIIVNSYAILFLMKPAAAETKNNNIEMASVDEYAQISSNFYDSESPNP